MKNLYKSISALMLAMVPMMAGAATPRLIAPIAAQHDSEQQSEQQSAKQRTERHSVVKAKNVAGLSTDRPAGEYHVYNRGGSSLFLDWEGIYESDQSSMLAEVVFAENNVVWMRNVLTYVNDNIWIQGTLSDDGTKITIPVGVKISYDSWEQQYLCLYPATLNMTDNTVSINTDIDEISYSIAEGIISLNNTSGLTQGIGAFYDEGLWAGMMDVNTVYTPSPLQAVAVPDNLATSQYQLICINDNYSEGVDLDNLKGVFINIGREGNDIYISGLVPDDSSAWAKGSISGNVVTIAKDQLMGVSSGYGLYLEGATYEKITYDWGWTQYNYTISDQDITFTLGEDGSLTSPSIAMIVSTSTVDASLWASYIDAAISPAFTGSATPKTPTFTSVNCWDDEFGEPYYGLAIRTSQIDNDNHLLDRSKMFYVVEVNGEEFTFTPDVYTSLDEAIKEVPLTLNDNDFFYSLDNFQNFYIFRTDIESFGVRVIYYGGDQRVETPTTIYTVDGIHDITISADDAVADVYDLCGRKVNRDNLTPGIYISNDHKFVVK